MTDFEHEVYVACKASARQFVLHPEFRRANLYSQQLRVLALVRQMYKAQILGGDQTELIILGGGVAGMTAAAAGLTGGVNVTLIEPNNIWLERLAEASHRELHPNIILWPYQPLRAVTNLPFLNWSCSKATTVRRQIVDQWMNDFVQHVRRIHDKAIEIRETKDGVSVVGERGNEIRGHAAIITVGWEKERQFGALRTPSYWTTPSFEPPGDIIISGTGDGGLIDSAYQIFGPKAVAAARALAYALEKKPHKGQILAAEAKALELFDAGQATESRELLDGFYSNLSLEDEDLNLLNSFTRPAPLKSRLLSRYPTPYEPTTSPINKVLVSQLARPPDPKISVVAASLTESNDRKVVALTPSNNIVDVDPSRLLVRHGADHAAWQLMSNGQIERLQTVAKATLTSVVPDKYDKEFYLLRPVRPLTASSYTRKEGWVRLLTQLVMDMVHHVVDGEFPTFKRVREPDVTLELFSSKHSPELQSLFPITCESYTIILGSPVPRFRLAR